MLITRIEPDPIYGLESYLIETCEEYDINYKTMKPMHKKEPATEGVLSSVWGVIKTIFKKLVALIVGIWKAIVGVVKYIYGLAKKLFKAIFTTEKKISFKVEIPQFTPTGIQTKQASNPAQLEQMFNISSKKLNDEIATVSKNNVEFVKKWEKIQIRALKESYDTMLEDVAYNSPTYLTLYDKELDKLINNPKYKDNEGIQKLRDPLQKAIFIGPAALQLGYDKNPNVQISFQGNDATDHIMLQNLEFLNTKKLNIINESKNLVEDYEKLKNGAIDEIIKKYKDQDGEWIKKLSDNPQDELLAAKFAVEYNGILMKHVIPFSYEAMTGHYKMDPEDVKKFLANSYFPDFSESEHPEREIHYWAKLKTEWNRATVEALKASVKMNYELYKLTCQEAKIVSGSIENEDFRSIRNILDRTISSYFKFNKLVLDCRPLGLGCVIFDKAFVESPTFDHKLLFDGMQNLKKNDILINYMTHYDVTIMGHGVVLADRPGEWFVEEEVVSPDGKYRTNVIIDMVRYLIKTGFKRINIVCCNGLGDYTVDMPPDIKNNRNVLVRFSKSPTYIG